MSILDLNQNTGPTVEAVASRLTMQARRQFLTLVESYESGLRNFWRNSNYTPQELSDALGTTAAELFTLHGTIKHIILNVKPDQALTSVDSYGTFQMNVDGTITILSDTRYPQEEPSVESGSIDEASGSI